jgi:hypothetical protein
VATKPTENVENEVATADGSIPRQSTHHAAKDADVKLLVVDGEKTPLKDRLKSLVSNKKVVGTVSVIATVVTVAARVYVVKHNDDAPEDENISS